MSDQALIERLSEGFLLFIWSFVIVSNDEVNVLKDFKECMLHNNRSGTLRSCAAGSVTLRHYF